MQLEKSADKRLSVTGISGIELFLPEGEEIFNVNQLNDRTLISSENHIVAMIKKPSEEEKTRSGLRSFAWLLIIMIIMCYILANTFYQTQIENYYEAAQAKIIEKLTPNEIQK